MKKLLPGLKGLWGKQKERTETVASPGTERQLQTFQKDIQYRFRDPSLLQLALKHRSWQGGQGSRRGSRTEKGGERNSRSVPRNNQQDRDTNERLEFLGDSVLNLVTSEYLFRRYPEKREGEMTRYKSLVVNGEYLTKRAIDIGLGRLIFMSNAEEKMGGRRRNSILEDAYEALIGAIYIDGGLDAARTFIERQVLEQVDVEKLDVRNRNHKSALLEFAQGHRLGMPEYKTLRVKGPDHQRLFEVEVSLQNTPLARGEGKSKKGAQQQAADRGLKALASDRSLLQKLKRR